MLLREAKGLSQKKVMKMSGIPSGRVSEWETGKRHPLFGSVAKYAEALGYELILVPKEDKWI